MGRCRERLAQLLAHSLSAFNPLRSRAKGSALVVGPGAPFPCTSPFLLALGVDTEPYPVHHPITSTLPKSVTPFSN